MKPANDNSAGGAARAKSARSCPVCRTPSTVEFDPFCSKRCADVDLHRWLSGRYAIPADDDEEDPAEDR